MMKYVNYIISGKHLALFVLLVGASISTAQAFEWSDTSMSWTYGPNYHEPGLEKTSGNAKDVNKNIIGFNHIDGYKYGTNFFDLNMLLSNSTDHVHDSEAGAVEFYAIYRHTLSLSKITDWDVKKTQIFDDVGLTGGFILNSKNDAVSSTKKAVVLGPKFTFNTPGKSILQVSLLYYKENNNNSVTGKKVHFDSTYSIESNWEVPFHLAQVPFAYTGFTTIVGPKGDDGFGESTKTEFLLNQQIKMDIGHFFDNEDVFWLGVGWEYWRNKYGADHSATKGALQSTPYASLQVHF